jgi:hypothetical protein
MFGLGRGLGGGQWVGGRCFRCQRYVPQAVGAVAGADDEDLSLFVEFDVVLSEKSDAVVIA